MTELYEVSGTRIDQKYRDMALFHLRRIHATLPLLDAKKMRRWAFSSDASFLCGDFRALSGRNFLSSWLLDSSRLLNRVNHRYNRVIPVPRRRYTDSEILDIKFSLHVMMSFGATVHTPVVISPDYLDRTFGSDDYFLLEGVLATNVLNLFGATALVATHNPSDIGDLFVRFTNRGWRERNDVLSLRYRNNSWSVGVTRKEPLKKYYGDFLYLLQDGRCAITGQHLDSASFQVDHIFPASRGGNNTLINLQAVTEKANREKTDRVGMEHSRCFSDTELVGRGYDAFHPYPELAKRDVAHNPVGYLFLEQ